MSEVEIQNSVIDGIDIQNDYHIPVICICDPKISVSKFLIVLNKQCTKPRSLRNKMLYRIFIIILFFALSFYSLSIRTCLFYNIIIIQ